MTVLTSKQVAKVNRKFAALNKKNIILVKENIMLNVKLHESNFIAGILVWVIILLVILVIVGWHKRVR